MLFHPVSLMALPPSRASYSIVKELSWLLVTCCLLLVSPLSRGQAWLKTTTKTGGQNIGLPSTLGANVRERCENEGATTRGFLR